MNKAVFLDRDGVINEEVDHLNNVADLRILPGAASAIKKMNEAGYHVIVVSNQAAIAKGIMTPAGLSAIHDEMKKRLADEGARIDGIYYCPHHPDGTLEEYSFTCACRKPETGMIDQAAKDFDIEVGKSFMVGDTTGDILTGRRAGLKTILVKTGYAGKDNRYDVSPDFIAEDLSAATQYFS